MRLAMDVMGGDRGPRAVLEGVALALRAPGTEALREVHLVGRREEIGPALRGLGLSDPRLRVHPAAEVLTMEDKPTEALRRKKDASMFRAIELVRDGAAEAVLSLGNTGALFAAATVRLRPVPGVERAAIAAVLPAETSEFVLLDAGANLECKPVHLLQFALMGEIYAREILGKSRPRVGLLSNGTEDGKGTELTRAVLELCRRTDLHFLGHIEGHDLFADRVDVAVTDGFTGNIVLKTAEGLGKAIHRILKAELTRSPLRISGAWLARGAFRQLRQRMNPYSYGGAPLLGLDRVVIKSHGSAGPGVVANAIRQCASAVSHRLNELLARRVAAPLNAPFTA